MNLHPADEWSIFDKAFSSPKKKKKHLYLHMLSTESIEPTNLMISKALELLNFYFL